MKIEVTLDGKREVAEIGDRTRVEDLLEFLKIEKNEVLTTIADELICFDEELHDGDSVKIFKVVTGG